MGSGSERESTRASRPASLPSAPPASTPFAMVALTLASALGVFVLRATRRGRRTSPPASRGAKKPLSPPRPAPPAEDQSALDAGLGASQLGADGIRYLALTAELDALTGGAFSAAHEAAGSE